MSITSGALNCSRAAISYDAMRASSRESPACPWKCSPFIACSSFQLAASLSGVMYLAVCGGNKS